MPDPLPDERFFEALAAGEPDAGGVRAPARLKSRVFSALIELQTETGSLASLSETRQAGHGLCVFETLVEIVPVGEKVKSFNFCRICHARVLAEGLQDAPIFWSDCPYVRFQNR